MKSYGIMNILFPEGRINIRPPVREEIAHGAPPYMRQRFFFEVNDRQDFIIA